MAVITRYIVVRNGVELDQVFDNKKEAEAYDKMLDAAADLAGFMKQAKLEAPLEDDVINAIAIHLAKNAPEVNRILKGVKPLKEEKKTTEKQTDKTSAPAPKEEGETSDPKAKKAKRKTDN